ncbi:hypothetical protein K523DRAFT_149781 [Schizophyllum commune Tattone D]|nr:hypothetical protein K523DRAFT_149781 [Schizophyllum commune Tattone D]
MILPCYNVVQVLGIFVLQDERKRRPSHSSPSETPQEPPLRVYAAYPLAPSSCISCQQRTESSRSPLSPILEDIPRFRTVTCAGFDDSAPSSTADPHYKLQWPTSFLTRLRSRPAPHTPRARPPGRGGRVTGHAAPRPFQNTRVAFKDIHEEMNTCDTRCG